jgi:hypothetical protein
MLGISVPKLAAFCVQQNEGGQQNFLSFIAHKFLSTRNVLQLTTKVPYGEQERTRTDLSETQLQELKYKAQGLEEICWSYDDGPYKIRGNFLMCDGIKNICLFMR